MEYNKRDDSFCRRWSKKLKAIRYLGGKCRDCGTENVFALNFHHIENKDENLYRLISAEAKWERIESELNKCILLCRNCHSKKHYSKNNPLKVELLKIKGQQFCQRCGYKSDKTSVFDFHHINREDKKFIICETCRTLKEFTIPIEEIILEMDKCEVLCANCHAIEHAEVERFNKFKETIELKAKQLKNQNHIPKEEILKLFHEGFYGSQIARKLKCGTTTISKVLKAIRKTKVGNKYYDTTRQKGPSRKNSR